MSVARRAATGLALVSAGLAGCNWIGELPDLEPVSTGASSSSGTGGASPYLEFCDAPDRFNGDLSGWDPIEGTASIVGVSGNPALRLDASDAQAEIRRIPEPTFVDCAGSMALLETDGTVFLTFLQNSNELVELHVTNVSALLIESPPPKQTPFTDVVATHIGYAVRQGILYVGYRDATGWHLHDVGAKTTLLQNQPTYAFGVFPGKTHALLDDYNVVPIAFSDLDAATK